MTAEEPGGYWHGRVEAQLEAIAESLAAMEVAQLRRHEESKRRLGELEGEIQELREWRSFVKGESRAWAAGASLIFSLLFGAMLETLRYLFGKR